MAKILQLLRSNTVYADKTAAVNALSGSTFLNERKDGEIVLARYYYTAPGSETEVAKSIMGVYHVSVPLGGAAGTTKTGVTILEDNSAIDDVLAGLDYNLAADDNKVVTDVNQNNGLVSAESENLTAIKLAGYTVGADNSGKVAATDTLGEALGKLQGQINGMDKTASAANGQVVTTVSEADGIVSETKANVKDLQLGGYSKGSDTGAIGSTDTVNTALSKIENTIAKNTVSSTDKTVKIDTTGATTDLSVNIDGTTLVKNASTGVISSDLKIKSIAQAAGSTYASQYQLVYGSSETPIGDIISVGKDQFLKEASYDATTQKLTLVMYNSTGGTTDIEVDFSEAVIEAEAGDGLYVKADHSLNIGIDNTSESVIISDDNGGSTTAAVLSVSSDAIKVSNIQAAINYAVAELAVSAQGDNYITAAVDAIDNKKINVTADVQSLTASAGTVGTYNTEGAQTAAPVDATLSGVADSLVDGADVAAKVTTFVNGAIAIEAARADANTLASIKALDATVGSTTVATGKHVAVQVVEVDGVLTGVTVTEDDIASDSDLTAEITRAKAAETAIDAVVGLTKANDSETRTYTNTGTYIGKEITNTVKSDIKALDTEVANALNGVTGSDAIGVTAKASKNQTISLTLDETTTESAAGNQYVSNIGSNVLKITSNGLYLSNVWDCGTF